MCVNFHFLYVWGAPVIQSVERWTCDWKVAGSNPGLEGPCETISIFLFCLPSLSVKIDTNQGPE